MAILANVKGKGGILRSEPLKESQRVYQIDDEDIHYFLTLDPTIKDHRIIALIIDHTSKQGECSFYRPDNKRKQCNIASRFMVMWADCGGKCFVHGLTCPIIIEYLENRGESENNRGLPEANGKVADPS